VHRIPADRANLRMIDPEAACDAIGVVGELHDVRAAAARFETLGDPTRLSLLLCIHRVGPIAVSDLVVATGARESTVSQALRLLRHRGGVTARRDGRTVRYSIAEPAISALLTPLCASSTAAHHHEPCAARSNADPVTRSGK
jgi:DNA-binding transcriptional ArsR family regulator